MKVVLLSGGSGSRLWPLSGETRAKQFLHLLPGGESMLERIYGQLSKAGLAEQLTVVTGAAQRDSVLAQLNESSVRVVTEPRRRNTFPAIALACANLYFEQHCDRDETVLVLPVDPFVPDSYFAALRELEPLLDDGAQLALMGARPVYAAEKYGYILPADGVASGTLSSTVSEFLEKPDRATAAEWIDRGALWNCGVFAFRLDLMLRQLEKRIACTSYADVLKQYDALERNSFDRVLLEKSSDIHDIRVVRYRDSWIDIGTWNTITAVMEQNPIGNVRMAADCGNTHVINEIGIPIVVMGAKDMVVVASPDGILIADKEQSSYLEPLVQGLTKWTGTIGIT
ncbi:MAG: NTP transferase domain-containing protein [Oscillospiraceae bacterium]|jgi:mannose-1-phosphate guanylyltransferase|nr:NTP transferase domain-containing protein [Oscillospiraceae bacterium]